MPDKYFYIALIIMGVVFFIVGLIFFNMITKWGYKNKVEVSRMMIEYLIPSGITVAGIFMIFFGIVYGFIFLS